MSISSILLAWLVGNFDVLASDPIEDCLFPIEEDLLATEHAAC
jgi:hypothetical protein